MHNIMIGTIIIGYTGFIIYKKNKDRKAGKTCCGGCVSCSTKGK